MYHRFNENKYPSTNVRNEIFANHLQEIDRLGIEFINFDFSLFGPLPTGNTNAAVQTWRDAGGTVEIHSFHILWGPLGIDSAGTVALDGEMRPIGALTADITGYGDVIDALIMSNIHVLVL